jgi:hypothetical protein
LKIHILTYFWIETIGVPYGVPIFIVSISLLLPFGLGIEVIYLAMILDTNRWCALWCALWFDNLGLGIEVRYLAMILDKNGVSFGVLIVSLPIIFPMPYF